MRHLAHKLSEDRCFGLDRWKRVMVHTWVRVRLKLKCNFVLFGIFPCLNLGFYVILDILAHVSVKNVALMQMRL